MQTPNIQRAGGRCKDLLFNPQERFRIRTAGPGKPSMQTRSPILERFDTPDAVAMAAAHHLARLTLSSPAVHVALSGGTTPRRLFRLLASQPFRDTLRWESLQLFWGDERNVPPDHADSNFGAARDLLLATGLIPEANIHRIRGEIDPERESQRYGELLKVRLPTDAKGFPRFDLIFLGIGEDGHTASLFPGHEALKEEQAVCAVTAHPRSGQRRITLTLPAIRAAREIMVLVTGWDKRDVLHRVIRLNGGEPPVPAARIYPHDGILTWMVDDAAAARL